MAAGGDDAVRPEDLGPHRVGARRRGARRLLRALLRADGQRRDHDGRRDPQSAGRNPPVSCGLIV